MGDNKPIINKNMNKIITVFVYGTLKRGKPLHNSWMHNSKFIDEDKIKGTLYLLSSYPAINEGNKEVPGEIFEMPEKDFIALKAMEHMAGYKTKKIKTIKGREVKTFFYKTDLSKTSAPVIDAF